MNMDPSEPNLLAWTIYLSFLGGLGVLCGPRG